VGSAAASVGSASTSVGSASASVGSASVSASVGSAATSVAWGVAAAWVQDTSITASSAISIILQIFLIFEFSFFCIDSPKKIWK
jgi:hypothetical protein